MNREDGREAGRKTREEERVEGAVRSTGTELSFLGRRGEEEHG